LNKSYSLKLPKNNYLRTTNKAILTVVAFKDKTPHFIIIDHYSQKLIDSLDHKVEIVINENSGDSLFDYLQTLTKDKYSTTSIDIGELPLKRFYDCTKY
jgi:hypothetical protein